MTFENRLAELRATSPIEFFKGFLRNPKEVGSVIPSSRFLIKRVLRCGAAASSKTIVELGPGTGVLTHELLRQMPADGKLIAVEISEDFVKVLHEKIHDPRFHLFQGSASDLEKALEQAGETKADLVVSGIPFSTLERGVGGRTLEAAKRVLSRQGRFVAYQFRSHVRRYADPIFGPGSTHSGFWNLPPMRIYTWRRDQLGR